MSNLRLLLVGENAGLLDALERYPGVRVAGRARSCAEAIRRTAELAPDVVVIDVALPDASGLHAVRRIKADVAAPYVVLTTSHSCEVVKKEAMAAGADLYSPKSDITELLGPAIERLAERRDAESFATTRRTS